MGRDLPYNEKTPLGKAIHDMGLTAKTVAEMCGLHSKTVEGYCKPKGRTGARTPSQSTLRHICGVLKLNPLEFETGRDQVNPVYLRPEELGIKMEEV